MIYNGNGQVVDTNKSYNYAKWEGKSLLVEGNSLTAGVNWGQTLATHLGMTFTNKATGGGVITKWESTGGKTMSDIIAIVNDYPAKVDLLIAQGDSNIGSWEYGTDSDQMDGDDPKTTWAAAMNYYLRCVRAKYPNILIVFMPDNVRYGGSANKKTGNNVQPYDFEPNAGSGHDYMGKIAKYNRCIFWDFDGATPFNPNHDNCYYSSAYSGNTQDYTHPSSRFSTAKGYALAHWVAGLTFNPDAPNDAVENWQDNV